MSIERNKRMKLPFYIIPKLNNLTNSEMTLYLWLCERKNSFKMIKGVRVSDLMNLMSKQSFYNALAGLEEKGLIYVWHRQETHDYDIGLWFSPEEEEDKNYINLHRELFQSEEFKKLNSKEKYLLFTLYMKTSVTISPSGSKAISRMMMEEFYAEYTKILQRTKRRIREYLHNLKKFFNIIRRKEKDGYKYHIGRNRHTYSLDKKIPGAGINIYRKYHIKAMIRRHRLKGAGETFIDDLIKIYRNYIKNYNDYQMDRFMEKAIMLHTKDKNENASAARVHELLRQELEF